MNLKRTLLIFCFIEMLFLSIKTQAQQPQQNANENIVSIGDSQLQFDVSYGPNLKESGFQSHGQGLLELDAVPWAVQVDGKTITPTNSVMKLGKILSDSVATYVEFTGTLKEFSWKLSYNVSGAGRITKSFSLTPKRNLLLELVTLWNANATLDPIVSSTDIQDIAAFYREGSSGMFISLDFPYSKITVKNHFCQVFYPPFVKLKKGEIYTAHTITLGATMVKGRQRFGIHEGEVASMDSYVQERYKPRFDRPMFATSSINNRYTQPRGDVIFYTMKDHPTLTYNKDLLKRELALMPKLGIEYYQVFPGVFDWVPGDPHPDTVMMLMDYARHLGVRMGDYSGTGEVFCPHYNNHRNSLDKPEWRIKTKDGKRNASFCFGVPEFVDFYLNTVKQNAKKYGFETHILDFLNIQPCYETSHGHPAGKYSIYQQVSGLVRILEGINSVSPEMMTWSNSGNWAEFLPKIAWSNHNLYLTDPYISLPFQGLNMTRLLDDARREQMVSLHYSTFIPYRFLTNCQYFFSQNSIAPDLRNYQFGALSTLAVTPNLTLGEVRPWIDDQSPENQREIISFYKHWTGFIEKNFKLWKQTYHVGDDPGISSVEIYSHAEDDHGFIFVVNSSFSDRTVKVPIDGSLGFNGQNSSELLELYPVEQKRLTAQGPFFMLGSELPIHVSARQVVILEVRPAPEKITPTLYGLPGTIENTRDGYLLKTKAIQGQSSRIAVLLPEGSQPIISANVRMDVPKQMERQIYTTPLKLIGSESNKGYMGFLIDIQFRRETVPTELRHWQVKSETLQEGLKADFDTGFSSIDTNVLFPLLTNVDEFQKLPLMDKVLDSLKLGPLANFRGAYIENAFGEIQDTWIELKTGEIVNGIPDVTLKSDEVAEESLKLPALARDEGKSWWLETEFNLPFMYAFGAEPSFDEHTFLVLPLLRRGQVKEIRAWLNGKPLNIQAYNYPRNRNLGTFYADLVGTAAHGGRNKLVLHLEY